MWELIAELAIAAGSIISNLYTNKKNSEQVHQSQNWQEDMMDKQNDYNDPSNVIAREQNAGIYRNVGAMGSGTDISTPSAGVGSSSLLPFVDPFTSASQNMLSFMQSRNQAADVNDKEALRQYRVQETIAQTDKYRAEINKLGLDSASVEIANEYAAALNEIAIAQGNLDLEVTWWQQKQLQAGYDTMIYNLREILPAQLQESLDRHELNVLDQKKVVAEIRSIDAGTAEKQKHTDLMDAQLDTEGVKQSLLAGEIKGQALENEDMSNQIKLFLETYDDQVSIIASQAKMSKKDAQLYLLQKFLGFGKDTAIGAGAAAAGYRAIKAGSKAARVAASM